MYQVKDFMVPFVTAILLSYILNPLVVWVHEKMHISHQNSVLVVTLFLILLLTFFVIFLLPILYNQTVLFFDSIPSYIENFSNNFYPYIVDFFARFNIEIEYNFIDLVKNHNFLTMDSSVVDVIVKNTISSTSFLINILSLIFIVPFLVYYLLKDHQIMLKKIENFLPKKFHQQSKEIIKIINNSIRGYICGQSNVCLILAIYYSISLTLIGLNNSLFVGFISGLFIFVPYIGFGVAFVVAILMALFQWGFVLFNIGLVLMIYLIGQIIESNFLLPQLVGKEINIHPVWMIFGVFFFGTLFGFFGIIFSVPLIAVSGNLLRYFAANYFKNS